MENSYNWRGGFCMEVSAFQNTIVIFGASGDLAGRKLFPALFQLSKRGGLHEKSRIIGCARTGMSNQEFRNFLKTKWFNSSAYDRNELEEFLQKISYSHGDYSDPAFYQKLRKILDDSDISLNPETSGRIYYLAVPPGLCQTVVKNLSEAGLLREMKKDVPWRRVVFEKPFGSDYQSSLDLDSFLHKYLQEHQIYRIDHYLGKETVQNIFIFRFANLIFEPVWNAKYIDYVEMTVAESVGVEHRGGYFDQTGFLRDMFQNHILEMLSLVTMEQPEDSNPESVRNEKLKLLQSIRIPEPDKVIRGQYRGYLSENGISAHSSAETFVAMKLFIDNERWNGVPFYIRSGKMMQKKQSSISIHFKQIPHSVFFPVSPDDLPANVLTMNVQPEEGFSLKIQAKYPGPKLCIGTLDMGFRYDSILKEGETIPDSYQRLLLDCMLGDQTLFIRSDTIAESWKIITPVLELWRNHPEIPLYPYAAGSWGPAEVDRMLAEKHNIWINT